MVAVAKYTRVIKNTVGLHAKTFEMTKQRIMQVTILK